MIYGIVSFLLLFSLCCSMPMTPVKKHSNALEPDCYRNASELIRSKGYTCEEHKVITPDGYILGVFRIPRGRNALLTDRPGPPVLLQHGLLDSGATWVMNFPDQSLGFILADAGYDVWIGNMRGNRYSRAHVKYDPNHDEAFWDFSYDEMSSIDLPSMAYYILNATQRTHIAYVGHSQGTMIGFANFGRVDSVLSNNVSFWTALAPVAHLGHIESPIRYLSTATVQKDLEIYWHLLFGRNEFMPSNSVLDWLGALACSRFILDKVVCDNLWFVLFGPEKKNLNETRLPVYVAHEPDGTSVKNMIHFAQGVQSNIFQAYNYSTAEENQKHYNQSLPPVYTLDQMKVPTALFYGGDDWLADPTDVQYILDNAKSLVYKKYIPNYDHADFIISDTANRMIYDDLVGLMKKYHPLD